jgi:enoyl-CoA hydratase/carnithine racemase
MRLGGGFPERKWKGRKTAREVAEGRRMGGRDGRNIGSVSLCIQQEASADEAAHDMVDPLSGGP